MISRVSLNPSSEIKRFYSSFKYNYLAFWVSKLLVSDLILYYIIYEVIALKMNIPSMQGLVFTSIINKLKSSSNMKSNPNISKQYFLSSWFIYFLI